MPLTVNTEELRKAGENIRSNATTVTNLCTRLRETPPVNGGDFAAAQMLEDKLKSFVETYATGLKALGDSISETGDKTVKAANDYDANERALGTLVTS